MGRLGGLGNGRDPKMVGKTTERDAKDLAVVPTILLPGIAIPTILAS